MHSGGKLSTCWWSKRIFLLVNLFCKHFENFVLNSIFFNWFGRQLQCKLKNMNINIIHSKINALENCLRLNLRDNITEKFQFSEHTSSSEKICEIHTNVFSFSNYFVQKDINNFVENFIQFSQFHKCTHLNISSMYLIELF